MADIEALIDMVQILIPISNLVYFGHLRRHVPQFFSQPAARHARFKESHGPLDRSLQFLMCHKESGPRSHADSLNAIPKAKSLTVVGCAAVASIKPVIARVSGAE